MKIRSLAKKLKIALLLRLKGSLFSYRFHDQFYNYHQSKLRGSLAAISDRLTVYLPYLKKVKLSLRSQHSFLDCGFGRGEFMNLLRQNKLAQVVGVDLNSDFVADIQEKGFKATKGDMINYLYLSDELYSGISAFHVIEHLTFDQLFDFLLLSYKKLAKGGILILETPNVENLIVSSTSYYYDHTHIQKVTRETLDKLLAYLGFTKVFFLPLHPIKAKPKNEIERYLFGAQDLGIVAYK